MKKCLLICALALAVGCVPAFADGNGSIGGAVGYSAKLGDMVAGPLLGILGYPKAEPIVSLSGGYLAADDGEVWVGGLMLHLPAVASRVGLKFSKASPLNALGGYLGAAKTREGERVLDYGVVASIIEIPF